jgi:hypothetical protein
LQYCTARLQKRMHKPLKEDPVVKNNTTVVCLR